MGTDAELEAKDQCVPFDFREDLVQEFRTTIKYISMTICVLSVILDVAIYKKRNLVNLILYMELTHVTLLTTIPSASSNYTDLYIFCIHCVIFLVFYTDTGAQIIFMCLSQMA